MGLFLFKGDFSAEMQKKGFSEELDIPDSDRESGPRFYLFEAGN